jgi:calcineurin-like phosphoesterase family protein
LKSCNCNLRSIIVILVLFSIILLNTYFSEDDNSKKEYNLNSLNFLQNSYAIETTDDKDKVKKQDQTKDSKETDNEETDDNNDKGKSIFNFVAVGDWDCTSETEDTVDNIIDQDPELVLALGDLSYNGKAKCWLDLIEPIADKTKIVIGNHEDDSSKLRKDYMNYFGLEKQYYSFNQKNIHFLALSTETSFDEGSEQYEFAKQDLEKYSKDPFIDWIIVFYHQYMYGSGSGIPEEKDFREVYHPLFDKYKVDLALQGHLHVYERTYPITFNDDDEDEPVVQDSTPNIYKNPKGTIFLIVGTGGAHDMQLSSLKDFSAEGISGDFGIVNIEIENDQTPLSGEFIENGKKQKNLDEFKIIKDN